jgi:hypothetical protein
MEEQLSTKSHEGYEGMVKAGSNKEEGRRKRQKKQKVKSKNYVEKGSFVFLPHGIEHSYSIRNEKPIRLLAISSPAREGVRRGWGGIAADLESGQGELIASPKD